jgi:hypothetical protein
VTQARHWEELSHPLQDAENYRLEEGDLALGCRMGMTARSRDERDVRQVMEACDQHGRSISGTSTPESGPTGPARRASRGTVAQRRAPHVGSAGHRR